MVAGGLCTESKIDPACNLFIVLGGFGLILVQVLCLSFAPGNRSGNTCHSHSGVSDNRYAYYATLSFSFPRRTEQASERTQ